MKKLMLAITILLISGCAGCPYQKKMVDYQCGNEAIWVKYMKDGSAWVQVSGEKHSLHKVDANGAQYRYINIGSGVELWKKDDKTFVRVGNLVYPECKKIKTSM